MVTSDFVAGMGFCEHVAIVILGIRGFSPFRLDASGIGSLNWN